MTKLYLLLLLAALFAAVAAAYQTIPLESSEIAADSDLGMKLLSLSRRLEDEDNEEDEGEDEEDDEEEDDEDDGDWNDEEISWVAGYSLKFQGCHHIQQWNGDADEDADVRIETKRLVRFRLCPSSSCSSSKAAGCTRGYGDYIIDMNTFVQAYYEAKRQQAENDCEYYLNYKCNCDEDDNQDDEDFNQDYCEYDCFADAGMYQCVDENPYDDDEQQNEEFDVEDYLECAQFNAQNGDDGDDEDDEEGRRLEDGDADEQDAVYIGPYCANQGGAIYMGMFLDDTCTTFADEHGGKSAFKDLTGQSLPYSASTLVDENCMSCVEPVNEDDQNEEDQNDGDRVSEQCEQVYKNAGKCEANLPNGITDDPNNAGCNYIEGIRIVRQDGIIITQGSRKSPVMNAFIVIFAMAFAAMGFYVWYLRTRLGVRKNRLL